MSSPSNIPSTAKLVLLLGSHDENTQQALGGVKFAVADRFSGSNIYCITANQVELYSDHTYDTIVEMYDQRYGTIFVFDKQGNLLQMDDIMVSNYFDPGEETYEYMVEWAIANAKDLPNAMTKIRPVDKIASLAKVASAIILLRHQEKTWGGEYIEYTLAASKYGNKCHFMHDEKLEISAMAQEISDIYHIKCHTYNTLDELQSRVCVVLEGVLT